MASAATCAIALSAPVADRPDAACGFILPASVRQLGCALPVAPAGPRSTQDAREARQREFLQGRALARRLLADCGSTTLEVPAGPDRAPVWPPGFTGSISHTADWVGVAVARTCDVAAVGIDVEMLRPAHGLAPADALWLCAREWALWNPADCAPEAFAVLGFSAKEALYKCLYPTVRTFFDFPDAQLTGVDHARGALTMTLQCDLGSGFDRGRRLEGRFAFTGRHVFTAFVLQGQGAGEGGR